jgi:hypothetical protein
MHFYVVEMHIIFLYNIYCQRIREYIESWKNILEKYEDKIHDDPEGFIFC